MGHIPGMHEALEPITRPHRCGETGLKPLSRVHRGFEAGVGSMKQIGAGSGGGRWVFLLDSQYYDFVY